MTHSLNIIQVFKELFWHIGCNYPIMSTQYKIWLVYGRVNKWVIVSNNRALSEWTSLIDARNAVKTMLKPIKIERSLYAKSI